MTQLLFAAPSERKKAEADEKSNMLICCVLSASQVFKKEKQLLTNRWATSRDTLLCYCTLSLQSHSVH